jgi:hypothetical protein
MSYLHEGDPEVERHVVEGGDLVGTRATREELTRLFGTHTKRAHKKSTQNEHENTKIRKKEDTLRERRDLVTDQERFRCRGGHVSRCPRFVF